MRTFTTLLLACLALVSAASTSVAGDCCCSHCGCGCACEKVCRLVCEEKEVDVICWGCLCEDFCLPEPSEPGCKHCKTVCADCDAPCVEGAPYVEPKQFVWRSWIPATCAKLFTRKKLYKKVEKVTVPSYKWVVEDLCPHCESCCDVAAVDAADEATLPPPPVADARLLFTRK
jgi:hypothetical protein